MPHTFKCDTHTISYSTISFLKQGWHKSRIDDALEDKFARKDACTPTQSTLCPEEDLSRSTA